MGAWSFTKLYSVDNVGHQGDLTGALDGLGEIALMLSAGSGSAAWKDLAALGNEAAELCGVLIVDIGGLIDTELANLPALTTLVTIESQGFFLL